jgi:ribonucleoside-diphosphate reductase alpha chain
MFAELARDPEDEAFVSSFVKAASKQLHSPHGPSSDPQPVVRPLRAVRTSAGEQTRAFVVDRKGRRIPPRWDEITRRIEALCSDPAYGPPLDAIDAPMITLQVTMRFRNGISTREIDAIIVQLCSSFGDASEDWLSLAARICVSDLHKRSFASMEIMYDSLMEVAPKRIGARLSEEHLGIVHRFSKEIDARLDFSRDYRFDIFGFQTVARSFLLRSGARVEESTLLDNQLMERPQHWYMRIALGNFCEQPDQKGHLAPEDVARKRLQAALDYYDLLSMHLISHATPTGLNSGMKRRQESSCFQLSVGDNMESITDTWKNAALISKWSGGQSCAMHAIRAEGAPILGTGGKSSGIKRLCRVFNEVQVYVDQGGNRPGAFAMYLETWHADIFTFLELARLKGVPLNAPDLKYALWISDEFMREVNRDGDWYLMSPDESPGLHHVWGDEFTNLYRGYVAEGKYRRKVKARDIIKAACETIKHVGTPYMLFKDHINRKSNLNHVATITCSNLCAEVVIPCWSDSEAKEFGAPEGEGEYGVCTLGAIPLENYLVAADAKGDAKTDAKAGLTIDWPRLIKNAGHLARALDRIITLNYYVTEQCRRSSLRHRPIGIGIMGLADVFARLHLVFGSPEALALDRAIAAAIYYGAMMASTQMAEEEGSFPSFTERQKGAERCPASEGKLQPDMWVDAGHLAPGWEKELEKILAPHITADHWTELRERTTRGLRNAYVAAYMPTATTSNLIGQNECFEPRTANIYPRTTSAGEFWTVNRHLVRDFRKVGIWDDKMRKSILAAGGSVQGNPRVSTELQRLYRTAREMDQRVILQHAKARAPFICQTMSLNYYFTAPKLADVVTLLTLAWEEGLKTASYYMHSAPATGGQKSTVVAAAALADAKDSVVEDGSDYGSDDESDADTAGLPEIEVGEGGSTARADHKEPALDDEKRRELHLEDEAAELARQQFRKERAALHALEAVSTAGKPAANGSANGSAHEDAREDRLMDSAEDEPQWCPYIPPSQRGAGHCAPCSV